MDEKYKNKNTGKIVTIVKTERVNYDGKSHVTVYVSSDGTRREAKEFHAHHALVQVDD